MKINGQDLAVEGFADGAAAITLNGYDAVHISLMSWTPEERAQHAIDNPDDPLPTQEACEEAWHFVIDAVEAAKKRREEA